MGSLNNTGIQPSSMSKTLPKTIGSLIGEVVFLLLHHWSMNLGFKNGFSIMDTKIEKPVIY